MADLPPGAAELQKLGDAGFTADEITSYKEQTTDRLMKGGFTPKEIDSYWGSTPPDDSKLKAYVAGNASVLSADDKAKIAENPVELFRAGLQHGATSLLSGRPTLKAPPDMGLGSRIIYQAGQMVNEIPEMAAGFVGGGALGGAAGGAAGGVVTAPVGGVGAAPGAAIGTVFGAGAGANALPTAMREILTDYYAHEGMPRPSWGDVWNRASRITMDTLKAGAVGAVTNVAGGGAGRLAEAAGGGAIIRGGANIATQTATATTVGAAIEGQVPTLNDFVTGAALAIGLWGTGAAVGRFTGAQNRFVPSQDTVDVATNLRDIYVRTGMNPRDAMEHATTDPALLQEVLAPRNAQGAVVTPGLKALSPPEPAPYKPETEIKPPEVRRPEIAFGDSLAVGTIRHGGMTGEEADFHTGENLPGTARIGATTTEVLRRINEAGDDTIRGKDVLLSTGASNSPGKLDLIPQQIEALKAKGARSITIMGVGTNEKLAGVNQQLQKIADDSGGSVRFIGPLKHVASDGIHSTNYRDEIAGSVGTPRAAPAAGAAPAPTQTAPTEQAAPAAPSAPQGGAHGAPEAQPEKPVDLSKYATGNAAPGGLSSVVGVHPEFARRIDDMAQAMPPDIRAKFKIISGFRSAERERQVYAEQHPGQPVPEDSYHSHGMAVDVDRDPAVLQWINQNGERFGVGFTLRDQPGEENHLEPTEGGQRVPHGQLAEWASTNGKVPAQTTPFGGKLGTLVVSSPDAVTDEHLTFFRTLEGNRDGGADHAVSPAGAIGRNQITPDTARTYGFDPDKLQDADYNDMVAKHIIADLSQKFEGNLADMVVGWNAGPARARAWIAGGRRMQDLPLETQRMLEHAERLGALHEGYATRGRDIALRGQGDDGSWVPPEGRVPITATTEVTEAGEGGGRGIGPPGEPPIGGGEQLALPGPKGEGPFPLNEDMVADKILDIVGERDDGESFNPRRIISDFQGQLMPARRLDIRMGISPEQIGAEDMMRQTYGSSGRAEHFIRWGPLDPITFNTRGDASLIRAFQMVKNDGGTNRGFVAYLLAKHAIEKRDQGIATGVDADLADHYVAMKGVAGKYERAAETWRQVTDATVDYAVDSGLYTREQGDAMKTLNEYYLTHRRIMDPEYSPPRPPGRNFAVRRPAKKMVGSERQIDDPITATVDNIHTHIGMADRNRAIGAIINEANNRLPPEQALFTQVKVYEPPARRPSNWDARDANGQPIHTEWFDRDGNPINVDAAPAINLLDTYRSNGRAIGKNEFVWFNQGRMEIWHTRDPELAELMRTPWPGNPGPLAKIVRNVAALQRSGITGQLSFPLRAIWHGQIASTVLARDGQIAPYHDVMRGIMAAWNQDSNYQRWVANGGADAALSSIERNYVSRDLDRIWRETGSEQSVWNYVQHPIEAAQSMFEVLRNAQHRVEAGARVGYFLRNEANTGDSFKAALNSRTAYLDHSEPFAASWVQELSRWVPFMTVGFKDIDQFTRAIRERPVGTITKAAAWLTAPTVINYAANYIADQYLDPKDRYTEVPQWERDMYWVLPPIDGIRFKIPRPYVVGWTFATMPEHFMQWFRENSVDEAGKFFDSLVRQTVPPFTPTIAYPIAESWANKSFYTGRPLIKQSLEKVSGPMSYTPDTTETAKAIASVLNMGNTRLPLGNPIITDEFLKQWAGPAPFYLLHALEAPWRNDTRPWQAADLPMVGSFLARQPAGASQSITDFYTLADKFETAHADLQLALKHADPQEIARSATMQAGVRVTAMRNAIGGLSQSLQAIDQNPKMTAAEKRKYSDILTGQMVAVAQAGIKTMETIDRAAAQH